jgi:hypothetical protein
MIRASDNIKRRMRGNMAKMKIENSFDLME